jgi:uncharacterized protein
MKEAAEILDGLRNDILQLILMPTEACNLRCTYCYETFKYRRMEPRVIRGVKAYLQQRVPRLRLLSLSWFGGEPLLARDIIEDIQLLVASLSQGRNDLEVTGDITTNAFHLSRPVFERMLDLGVLKYQISFDGPKEWHDQRRVRPDGSGTFDRIWANVLAMREVRRSFICTLRVHVDLDNHAAIPAFLDQCAEAFAHDPRFTLYIRPLSRYGGPNDATLHELQGAEGERILRALRDTATRIGLSRARAEQSAPVCYASMANSFLVRANGRINKCTLALEDEANQVGRIHPDGRLELDAGKMRAWMRGLWSGDEKELECPVGGISNATTGADRYVKFRGVSERAA